MTFQLHIPSFHLKKFYLLYLGKLRSRLLVFSVALMHRRHHALQREIEEGKKPRRWHVRPIFRDHETHGAWFSLIPVMREHDRENYINFF